MTVSCITNESDKSFLLSVQLWMSRLQFVTAVVSQLSGSMIIGPLLKAWTQTAFFASIDGILLGRVGAYVPEDTSAGNILTHAALSGALALHTSAGTSFACPIPHRLTRSRPSYHRVSRVFRARKVQQDFRPNLRRRLSILPQSTNKAGGNYNNLWGVGQDLGAGPSCRPPIPPSATDHRSRRTNGHNRARLLT